MKTSIECEKCGANYVVKIKTTKEHIMECKCPFCGNKEKLEIKG